MRKLIFALALLSALSASPAHAVIDGLPAHHQAVVVITSPNGFCSGTMLSERVALTAAHCVNHSALAVLTYQDGQPIIHTVERVVVHPAYKQADWANGRTSVDLALVRTKEAVSGTSPAAFKAIALPRAGAAFTVQGYGPSNEQDGKTAGILRQAHLLVTGHPSRFQVRLKPQQPTQGRGACTGDSGGPAFQTGSQEVIGVVSWTMGHATGKCGALTGFVPLGSHYGWIADTLRQLEP